MALLGANTDINEAQSLSYKRETVDIYSNSWGPFDSGRNVEGPEYLTSLALKNGVREVWASGGLYLTRVFLVATRQEENMFCLLV